MPKRPFILLAFFAIIASSCSKDTDMAASVKYLESYTAYMIPFKYGQADEHSKFKWESASFNEDSTIRNKEYRMNNNFDPATNLLFSESYTYSNGVLNEKTEHTFSSERSEYSYSNNRLSGINVYGENGLVEKYIYEYLADSKNAYKMLYWTTYFDIEPTTHVYTYDINGNMVKDSIHYKTIPYGIIYREYDLHNNMTKESYYSSESGNTSVQAIRNYTYDSKGKVLQYVFSTIWFQKYIYQYSDNGLISQIDVFESKNGIDGSYEQKGILKYEYNYKER